MTFSTRVIAFLFAGSLCFTVSVAEVASDVEVVALQNEALRIEIERQSGNLVRITNLVTRQRLLELPPDCYKKPAWEIGFLASSQTLAPPPGSGPLFAASREASDSSDVLDVTWPALEDIRVSLRISLPAGAAPLEIRAAVENSGNESIASFRYPILYGTQHVGDDPQRTFFSAPFKVGHLFRDPIGLLEAEGRKRLNLFSFRYPGGHNLNMQFFSLYEEGRGGFYLATHDPHFTGKDFLLGERDEARVFSVTQRNWDTRPGRGMALDYPFVIAALTEGSWQEAADLYKKWAVNQRWAKRPLSARRKEIGWLFDQAAFTVFGISSRVDQRPWYQAFHDIVKGTRARVLFVPSWDWNPAWSLGRAANPADFTADFSNNLEVVRKNGDYLTPFYFDLKMGSAQPWWTERVPEVPGSPWRDHVIMRRAGRQQNWHWMCPTEEAFVNFHRWRDERLVGDYKLDGVYYDISVALHPLACNDPKHSHPPGVGRWMVEALRRLVSESRNAASNARGKPIVIGNEEITECLLDVIDFYHLGGNGMGPIRAPGSRCDDLLLSGRCTEIPLFAYVYHEYGTLRTGGKIQIAKDFGDAWYYITGQEYLWGGILELIYFNTPLELFPGTKPPTYQSGHGKQQRWEENPRNADPLKMKFLRECAELRSGLGREFLAYGTMLRQPPVETEIKTVKLSFWHYADIGGSKRYRKGEFPCPELLREAWRSPDGRLGLFFVNLNGEDELEVQLSTEKLANLYGLEPETQLVLRYPEGHADIDMKKTDEAWLLQLPPRRIIFLEAK